MLALYRNIKDRRLDLKLTQTDLAKRTGYSDKSMIAKIEAGKVDLPLSKIEIFADALEVSPSTLMGETWENDILANARLDIVDNFDGDAFQIAKFQESEQNDALDVPIKKETPNVEPISIGATVRIPVYGRIPAGTPMEAIEEIEDYIDVPVEMDPDSLLALKVVGNSMYPKYIEGDYVIIRRQPDCESGQDCAVRINGYDTTLKKVIKERDGIMLQPINPEYAPKKYEYTDEFNPVYIIGVVVELRRKV